MVKDILSSPTFISLASFLIILFVYYLSIDKPSDYFSSLFPLNLQANFFSINVAFVIKECPSSFQAYYVVWVFIVQMFFTFCSLIISGKLVRKRKNKVRLVISSYVISLLGLGVLLFTIKHTLFNL
jgi:hypothetical protein